MTVATMRRDVVLDTTREERIGFGEAVLAGTSQLINSSPCSTRPTTKDWPCC
jgi:hypothetical protein